MFPPLPLFFGYIISIFFPVCNHSFVRALHEKNTALTLPQWEKRRNPARISAVFFYVRMGLEAKHFAFPHPVVHNLSQARAACSTKTDNVTLLFLPSSW